MAEQLSLFQIKQNLLDIVNTLDEQDGEFTEEQLQELKCCEEDFSEKIKSYYYLTKKLEADVLECKTEKQRLDAYKKSKENKLNKLKGIIVESISQFGKVNNNGIRYLDYGTFNLSLRQSNSIEINELRLKKLMEFIEIMLNDCKDGIINGYVEFTEQYVLDYINQLAKADFENSGLEFIPYTEDDLNTLQICFKVDALFMRFMLNEDYKSLRKAAVEVPQIIYEPIMQKDVYKTLMKDNYKFSLVNNNVKQNLNAK